MTDATSFREREWNEAGDKSVYQVPNLDCLSTTEKLSTLAYLLRELALLWNLNRKIRIITI